MNIIFSRKGFDSAAGGGPSPILPDGEMISLPIPSPDDRQWDEINTDSGRSMAAIMRDLDIQPRPVKVGCHLDPDLHDAAVPRKIGWKPNLGQCGSAATHLLNQGVEEGDLFLFFGCFRHSSYGNQSLEWHGKGFHALFGFLQVEEVIDPEKDSVPAWLDDHPHVQREKLRQTKSNCIYVASGKLNLPGTPPLDQLPGGGRFRFNSSLRLSVEKGNKSIWTLPHGVFSDHQISYHKQRAWLPDGCFQSTARGQEFVVTDASSDVLAWCLERIRSGIAPGTVSSAN